MTVIAAQPTSTTPDDHVVWYRHPDQIDDHAFGVGQGWMRSRCHDVRWSVLMAPVEGTVRPCPRCLEAIAPRPVAPETALEERAANGDR